jgi:predicted dehydrogenase
MRKRLGIGIVGSGFIARFHLQSFEAVRDADVLGVWSPTRAHAEDAAAYARSLRIGEAKAYDSITAMIGDPSIDALWICGPNHQRIANFEEIANALTNGAGELKGIACEKPLARNVAEAKQVLALVKKTGVAHAYLEDQAFSPGLERARLLLWRRGASLTGRPYLARAAEEHSGPHAPWFWRADLQGGGVLNDMMCHSALLVRQLLTAPDEPLSSVTPVRVSGHIASLKWTRPQYIEQLRQRMGREVDYAKRPAEDFASVTIEFEAADGTRMLGEVSSSWCFVGPGLRLTAELLGPEYSLTWNTLDTEARIFFSREVHGEAGEDLVEKQNAEMGLMPVVANEAATYGYEAENRDAVRAFLDGTPPRLTFEDGVEVARMLMTAYMSAEQGRTLDYPPPGLDEFVPAVAKGEWKP